MSLFDISKVPNKIKPQKEKAEAISVKEKKIKTALGKARERLSDVIGKIEQNQTIHYVTAGDWSTHDLIFYLTEQIGPVHLIGATWSISEPACIQVINALNAGKILSMRFIFDWRVKVRSPKALQLAKMNMNDIRLTTCHAKVSVLYNQNWIVCINGSANYTNNPRIESGMICTIPEIGLFHKKWIIEELHKSFPFENQYLKRKVTQNA